MGKLLKALLLQEATSTSAMATSVQYVSYQGRKKRRKKTCIDKLYELASKNESLEESISFVIKNRSKLEESSYYKTLQERVEDLTLLDSVNISVEEGLEALCSDLTKILTEETGKVDSPLDGSYQEEHSKFLKELSKQFKIDTDSWEAIAEGLYLNLSPGDSQHLFANTKELKNLSFENDYLLVKRGNNADLMNGPLCCRKATWIFIYNDGLSKELEGRTGEILKKS